jgi:Mrp family chromosome partitioning ATPase
MSRNFEVLTGLAARIADRGVPSGETSAESTVAAPARKVYAPAVRKDHRLSELVQAIVACIGKGMRLLLLTEPTRELGGNEFLCADIAEELSTVIAGNVLLADANFDAPRVHRRFDRRPSPGLSESLRSTEAFAEFVQEINPNLWLLTAGSNNGLSVPHEAFRRRMTEMRQLFDVTLIAGPAALNGQMSSFGDLTDGAILMLRAHSTRRESAAKAKMQLEQARIPLIGAVLLDRTFPIPEKIYRTL